MDEGLESCSHLHPFVVCAAGLAFKVAAIFRLAHGPHGFWRRTKAAIGIDLLA
jgi:hypothetical protein